MTSKTSSGDLISERYSSALYELASDKKCVDDILDDFKKIEYVFKESSELKKVIKSMGGPTVKSLFMVESKETNAQRAASPMDNSFLISRSKIGLPYLVSPNCRKGLISEVLI